MLETIRDILLTFHRKNLQGYGYSREEIIRRETEELRRASIELGLYKALDVSIDDLSFDVKGGEHGIIYNKAENKYSNIVKVTLGSSSFGLYPHLLKPQKLDLHALDLEPHVEFVGGSPLEYLERWLLCNELFGDAARLERIVQWRNDAVAIVISQPQYDASIPTKEEISEGFKENGWEPIYKDRRIFYYNYAYDTIAIDADPRNCYKNKQGLQPFDVILSHPNDEMKEYLGI